jgi:hypothetical protein
MATRKGKSKPLHAGLGLRVTDQETARVVAIHRPDRQIVGSGCLVDSTRVLTCYHVVAAALLTKEPKPGSTVVATLAGIRTQPTVNTKVIRLGQARPVDDLALLEIVGGPALSVAPVEFASPLRHGGKTYSVMGFPGGDRQGHNVSGSLHATDAMGLVQMDRGGSLSVLGGFSGAPVWSKEVAAFVGLVVTEMANRDVSWCIPSRRLCEFHPELVVRFRIPRADRPQVHDLEEDDPNIQLFGTASEDDYRRLTAKVTYNGNNYSAAVTYECLKGAPAPRGCYVTFITYPDF